VDHITCSTVLNALRHYVSRFVHLTQAQLLVTTLWVVHTYMLEFADTTPYLAVTSAEKQFGKSRFLEVLATVVKKPWLTGRVTPAVLIRKVDREHPTLLLDESDAAFASNKEYVEALRGILNTGHQRSGKASCCVGQGTDISYRDFSTFCAKVIAGIGNLPDTVADRAIPIRLKRAAPGIGVEKFREREVRDEATHLRASVETWCAFNAPKLRGARPELPPELTTPRGYRREQFRDAFSRYLRIDDSALVSSASPQSATTQHKPAMPPSEASTCGDEAADEVQGREGRNNDCRFGAD
jgi:hypothetical protein